MVTSIEGKTGKQRSKRQTALRRTLFYMLGRHGPILPLLFMTRVFFHKAKVVLLECVFFVQSYFTHGHYMVRTRFTSVSTHVGNFTIHPRARSCHV